MRTSRAMEEREFCEGETRKGTLCRKSAGQGTSHPGVGYCENHGGCTPTHEVAGSLVLARREGMAMGVPVEIEPHDAILQCIQIAAGEVRYASERIAELEAADAAGPVVSVLDRPMKLEKGAEAYERVEEITHAAPALNIWIRTRHDAMDRLVRFSAVAIKAGIEERRVKVAENVGQALAGAIQRILEGLGVADHPQAPAVVRRELTVLAGGQAA